MSSAFVGDLPVPCQVCGDREGDPVGETFLCEQCLADRRERLETELEQMIQSENYREGLYDIITADNPSRDRQLWAAGFLAEGVGLGGTQTMKLLSEYIEWDGATPNTAVELVKVIKE